MLLHEYDDALDDFKASLEINPFLQATSAWPGRESRRGLRRCLRGGGKANELEPSRLPYVRRGASFGGAGWTARWPTARAIEADRKFPYSSAPQQLLSAKGNFEAALADADKASRSTKTAGRIPPRLSALRPASWLKRAEDFRLSRASGG